MSEDFIDLSAFLDEFVAEIRERLDELTRGLLQLEQTPDDPTLLRDLMRAAHTIKGGAKMMGMEPISRLSHAIEDVFEAMVHGQRRMVPALNDYLLSGIDVLTQLADSAPECPPHVEADLTQLIDSLRAFLEEGESALNGEGALRDGSPGAAPIAADDGNGATPILSPPSIAAPSFAPPQGDSSRAPESGGVPTPMVVSPPPITIPTPPPAPPPPAPPVATAVAPPAPIARAEAPPAPPSDGEARGADTIRVTTDLLDALMNRVRELLVLQQGIEADRQAMLHFQNLARRTLDRQQHAGLLLSLNTCVQRLEEHADRLERVVSDLQNDVVHARMVPLNLITNSMVRAVREHARARGKQVAFNVRGDTTPLDKNIVERLREPLIHMLRNSVDHGIELPEVRLDSGKSPEGTITLTARSVAEGVELRLEDDGAGINADRLRQQAISSGLMSTDIVQNLSDEDAIALMFYDGISTSASLTDTSGRGVGMAVVKRSIEMLRGRLRVQSTLKVGTTFTITLPLTLATLRVVVVSVGTEIFAIPADQVSQLLYVLPGDFIRDNQGSILRVENPYNGGTRPVPALSLSGLLGISSDGPPDAMLGKSSGDHQKRQAVVVIDSDNPLALKVDRLVDETEAVIQPLGVLLRRANLVRGAVTLSDGQLALVLDVPALAQAKIAPQVFIPPPAPQPRKTTVTTASGRRPRVLVVDDALTPRELLRSILSAAGYEVTTARDGLEAMGMLQTLRFDAMVSDVDMPRMNGFELVVSVRRDVTMNDLPIVLVTSRDSPEDRQKGIEAGAQGYIVKGSFNQDNLLDVLGRLVGE